MEVTNMARKRKPDHLKIVSGTAQKCRMNAKAPPANTDLPSPPEWLSERATEIFYEYSAYLSGMRVLSFEDSGTLSLLASRLEEVEICTGIIEDIGRTYTTNNGEIYRTRPEVAMRNEAMRQSQSLLSECGLTPAARSKVSVKDKKNDNAFAALG